MLFQNAESAGPAKWDAFANDEELPIAQFKKHSSNLPFGQPIPLSSISGPTYVTAQTLIQQVAYSLSDRLFAYSPETFDLDVAVKGWSSEQAQNGHGWRPDVHSMQTRIGAGSIALGYLFSKDFDLKKRHIPQTLIASSSSLRYLYAALDELSLLYGVASPFVAHVAAVDYAGGLSRGLVSDYSSALSTVDEIGLGLVCSSSAFESQHMALFSTLLARVIPTIHIYDGISMSRDTTRVIDVLDQNNLCNTYKAILKDTALSEKRHASPEEKVSRLLHAFNGELGTPYELFEYHGHSSPEHVLVVFGTVESSLSSQIVASLAEDGAKIGVVCVRVYRPFVEDSFIKTLPPSVKNIAVLGQVHDQPMVTDAASHSALYNDVLAAVTFAEKWATIPLVVDTKYSRDHSWTPKSISRVLERLSRKPGGSPKTDAVQGQGAEGDNQSPGSRILNVSAVQQYTFWDIDESASVNTPIVVSQMLSKDSSRNVTVTAAHDNLIQGGVTRTDIRTSKRTIEAPYPVEEANVCYVGEEKLLSSLDIVRTVKSGGSLVVRLPAFKEEDGEKRLPSMTRKQLADRNIEIYVIDPQASSSTEDGTEAFLTQLAFLRIAGNETSSTNLKRLSTINGNTNILEGFVSDLDKAVRKIEVPDSWSTVDPETSAPSLPSHINTNSFTGFETEKAEPPSILRDWEAAAKALTFREAYETKPALRPDLSVKTHTVHVKENRRLTPLDYDRNVFHIEFDLGDSGMTYDIGEALGVHAENNQEEVTDFINFYGLQPEEVVEVPSREDASVLELRTVYQSLIQNVDIFGRPPKRFYEALAEFADDENERKELLTLGGPEGANEFKRRAEVDTITYADILLEFPSAHPSFHDIVRIVNPMKRREYSIASSQKVTPTSVSLLVVIVGWVDPKGRDRFGQATRYMNKLRVGDPVTVSVKPSVMKLPPSSTQPLIMAGLGTGLAPFRAFVQYRAWQKAQGMDIGAVLLYMGSRHQREEYLYGEEWEAYQDAGVITLLGRAFSRDQPQKIYIQDRMRETVDEIIKAYLHEGGAFYLCGPTWPVPDVTDVLQEAIAMDAKSVGKKLDSRKEIDRLKEELRYVLEGKMVPINHHTLGSNVNANQWGLVY
ncbi:MAG: hypothetical protein M1837_002415 [Sclerophora amabilis]|nr:MAG: hypothetical protein M1837_002415 [Sclerophora amabilis]